VALPPPLIDSGSPDAPAGLRRIITNQVSHETPRELWMIDGFAPPPAGSDAEKLWAKENRAIPY
jgi:Putative oxalocrotonate tautomerase enzyme